MNDAALKGFRKIGSMGFNFGPRLMIRKIATGGWEALRVTDVGDEMECVSLGVAKTRNGAKELISVFCKK